MFNASSHELTSASLAQRKVARESVAFLAARSMLSKYPCSLTKLFATRNRVCSSLLPGFKASPPCKTCKASPKHPASPHASASLRRTRTSVGLVSSAALASAIAGCPAAAWQAAGAAASCDQAARQRQMSSSENSLFVAIDGAAAAQLIEYPAAVGQPYEVEQVPLVNRAIGGRLTGKHGLNLGPHLHHAVLRWCRAAGIVTVRIVSFDICTRELENFPCQQRGLLQRSGRCDVLAEQIDVVAALDDGCGIGRECRREPYHIGAGVGGCCRKRNMIRGHRHGLPHAEIVL